MKGNTLKYSVAVLLFISLTSTVVVGLLLAFIIPSGNGATRETKVFLALHRHGWADIHLTLSLILLGLIALHVIQNWNWIAGCSRSFFGSRWKRVLWGLCCAWVPVLFLAWLIAR